MRLILAILVLSGNLLSGQTQAEKDWKESNLQARDLYEQGKYDDALVLAGRALDFAEREFGSDHLNTATSLNDLAVLYYSKRDFTRAEPTRARPSRKSARN